MAATSLLTTTLLVVLYFVLCSAWKLSPTNTVCSLKPNVTASDDELAGVLSWICSPQGGVNCNPLQPGGPHFLPNTVRSHLEWAMNAYWESQMYSNSSESCDFNGLAELTCGSRDWKKIRGVNVGGFLVLEPWITPSLFQQFLNKTPELTAVDEYTLCQILGKEEATKQLTQHWETWVTEEDISTLASFGLNTLRVPVGYWIFGDFPPFVRGIEQLDRLIKLAAKYNLDVLVDLHGAPGSQNGFDNSGRTCGQCAGVCPPLPIWYSTPQYINQTVDIISRLAQRYASVPNVIGIEVLNEPRWDIDVSILKDFYLRAYSAIKSAAPNFKVFFHDAFRYNVWRDFMTPAQGFKDVVIDTHIYQAFSPGDITEDKSAHLKEACGYSRQVDWMECMQLPSVVGEWSLGITDCPLYLLGFQKPPTAPSFGVSCAASTPDDQFLTAFAAAQLNSWERGHGWFFWNFKTELAPDWSFIDAVKRGWLPKSMDDLPTFTQNACNQ